jgi:transmembrane sensor
MSPTLTLAELDEPLEPPAEAALQWLVRLHDGAAGPQDWIAYDVWRAARPEHAEAAAVAEELWRNMGLARPRRSGRAVAMLLVAGLVLLAGLWAGLSPGLFVDYRTGPGERRSVTLADGTRLDLDGATRLDVVFDARRRRIVLHDGTIHVAVAPDKARPFDVAAAGGRIRALGTAFDVRRRGDNVRVAVTEHAVRVSYPEDGPGIEVAAGNQVTYGPEGLGQPGVADLRNLTAWRRGRLIFDGRPLAEVLAEVERHRTGMIVIADARLRELKVTGVFDSDDADTLLDAVAATLAVRVRRLPYLAIVEQKSR